MRISAGSTTGDVASETRRPLTLCGRVRRTLCTVGKAGTDQDTPKLFKLVFAKRVLNLIEVRSFVRSLGSIPLCLC